MTPLKDYLANLLPPYLQPAYAELRALVVAAGKILDDLRSAIYAVRRAWLISTATGEALDLHAADRRLPRLAGETDDQLRNRLLGAYAMYAQGGTNQGLIAAVAALGWVARVRPMRLVDATRWAEFEMLITAPDTKPVTPMDIQQFSDATNRTRQARMKVAALRVQTPMSVAIYGSASSFRATFRGSYAAFSTFERGLVFLDGSRVLDGTWTLAEAHYSTSLRVNGTDMGVL